MSELSIDQPQGIAEIIYTQCPGRQQDVVGQIEERVQLIKAWGIQPGERVLEIGCGQGDCTVALAVAVGERGSVTAVDLATLDYGSPYTLGKAEENLRASPMGSRITFVQADPVKFLESHTKTYTTAVIAHCTWYFASPAVLSKILSALALRVDRICIAEWALSVSDAQSMPHLLATLARVSLKCRKSETNSNIRTVLTPTAIRAAATALGLELKKEETVLPGDGMLDAQREVTLVLSDGWAKEIGRLVDNTCEEAAVFAARDAVREAMARLKGKKVRAMDVWVATFAKKQRDWTEPSKPEPRILVHPTAVRRPSPIVVQSEHIVYTDDHITAKFTNRGADVIVSDGQYIVKPTVNPYEFQTARKVSKTGLMMIGWGGNNGTTLSATVLANRHNIVWQTKAGVQQPNYIGSLLRASNVRLGTNTTTTKDVYVPISDVLPMVHPNDLVLGGWDISGFSMDRAMERAQVLDWDLQSKVAPHMAALGKPLPSIYYPEFIAANQEARADNVVPGTDKQAHLEHIRGDIRLFKKKHGLDRVVVFWTANTERYSKIIPGVNDTADHLLEAIKASHSEVSPSTLFAVAAILEGEPFVNGAPQNTFVPGLIELAERKKSFIGGDDLKSGQTKLKLVLVEFLVNAGIKPLSIASYNHLGNNDRHNLSADRQFESKEISSVVDDIVRANALLFKPGQSGAANGEHPDHTVVIKYVPAVGDSERAIDEYYSEIFCGGRSTINIFNKYEDTLLTIPLILDLTILTELLTRIKYRSLARGAGSEFGPLYPVLSLLSYMLKAPLVKPGTDVVNSLSRQRNALEAFLKACIGLEGCSDLLLETRIW